MKLGEIKAEAMKLMFLNLDQEITAESIAALRYNDTYSSYISSMNGSIQRGLNRVANAKKLGEKSVALTNGTARGRWTRYDLKEIAPDTLSVRRIVRDMGGTMSSVYDYEREGKTLILPTLHRETDEYRLIYCPQAPKVTALSDTDELKIPEEVAQMIPYFVKGELYEEDEPGSAAQARNLFEQWLDSIEDPEDANPMIDMVYGWE